MLSMRPSRALPALLVGALLYGCGGGEGDATDPKTRINDARDEIQGGDHAAALKIFEEVLASDCEPKFKYRAKRDSLLCVAKERGAEEFQDELATLTEDFSDHLDAHELAKISQDLTDAKLYELAVNVIEAAKSEFISTLPEGEERDSLDKQFEVLAVQIAESEEGKGLTDKLKSLGYLGD